MAVFRSFRYRHDHENVVLVLTIFLVLGVIVLTSTVTFCLSGVFIIGMFILSAVMIRSHHQTLMRQTVTVDPHRTPQLAELVAECSQKLQPGPVEVFLANKARMNAYTFGIGDPKVLVLFSPLLKVMTPDELKFIIGHEMGHMALGHTWLNTIVGGLAGIPAPLGMSVVLYSAFRWWNRMCEFSADRAGLLACGDIRYAVSSLVKLAAPEIRSQQDFDAALAMIDAQDDRVANQLAEVFQSHPMLIRRINNLRDYARTEEYQWLQAGVNRNVGMVYEQLAQKPAEVNEVAVSDRPVTPQSQRIPEERWPWLKR